MYTLSAFLSRRLVALPVACGRSASSDCWSCGRQMSANEAKAFFCPCERKLILPANPAATYFELLHVDADYTLAKKDLTSKFRQLMRRLHPDLFTLKSRVSRQNGRILNFFPDLFQLAV